ncbi:MAG: GDYXXLXY domain-containing protein [Anaerolineae bacterium]
MTRSIRTIIFWASLAALFIYSGWTVFQAESAIENGKTVLIRLAPVDPRSLIQGDYMTLGYDLPESFEVTEDSGKLIATASPTGVVTFQRLAAESNGDLAENEFLIRYSRDYSGWRSRVIIGTNSFFFEEGTAELYEDARYGEFKITPDGTAYLVGLRDAVFKPLGDPAK